MWNGLTKRASRLFTRNSIFLLLILAGSAAAIGAMANGYSGRMKGLSGQIVLRAEQLRNATDGPTYDFREAEEILSELKGLINTTTLLTPQISGLCAQESRLSPLGCQQAEDQPRAPQACSAGSR